MPSAFKVNKEPGHYGGNSVTTLVKARKKLFLVKSTRKQKNVLSVNYSLKTKKCVVSE